MPKTFRAIEPPITDVLTGRDLTLANLATEISDLACCVDEILTLLIRRERAEGEAAQPAAVPIAAERASRRPLLEAAARGEKRQRS